MSLLSIGAWYNKKYELAIFTTAFSTFISWPFAALIGVPIAFDMLFVKKYHMKFFKWSLISAFVILVSICKEKEFIICNVRNYVFIFFRSSW